MRLATTSEVKRKLQQTYEGPDAQRTVPVENPVKWQRVWRLTGLLLLGFVIAVAALLMKADIIPDVPGAIFQDLPAPVAARAVIRGPAEH